MDFRHSRASVIGGLAAVLSFLAGCQLLTTNLSRTDTGIPAGESADGGAAQSQAGYGQLRLSVRWPASAKAVPADKRGTAGYRSQVIPASTAQLSVSITKDGNPVSIQNLDGSPANNPYPFIAGQASASIRLRAASGLSVAVSAIPESNAPSSASGNCATGSIAFGSATVNIVASSETDAAISLSSCYEPAISGIDPSSGNDGDTVTISGTNLTVPWSAGPSVTFNGVPATIASSPAPSATSLVVTVPTDGTGGDVVVTNDGVSSTGVAFGASDACPTGTYASEESCASCPAGTYNPNTGSTSITDCLTSPSGTYASEGSSQPTSCSAGTYNPNTGATSFTDCLTSPTGTYASEGSSQPISCPAGTYNPNSGSTSIVDCLTSPTGTYASEGSSQPINCPEDTYNPDQGATSIAQCLDCPGAPSGSSACE